MLNQYYILKKITSDLHKIIGYRIFECYSQEKDCIELVLFNSNEKLTLHFCANSYNDSLFLRENFARARKNTIALFDDIIDEVVQKIELFSNDRIIKFELINSDLYFVLFGRGKSNLYLTTKSSKILASLKDYKKYSGDVLEFNIPNLSDIKADSNLSIKNAIIKSRFMFTDFYADEVLLQCGLSPNIKVCDMNSSEYQNMLVQCTKLQDLIIKSNEIRLITTEENRFISLIPLKSFSENNEIYYDIHQAVLRIYSENNKQYDFIPLFKLLSTRLTKLESNIRKKIVNFDEGAFLSRAEEYREYGILLSSVSDVKQKGLKEIMLYNYNNEEIVIKLDEKKTIIENSEYYFLKSRKAREELNIRKKMIPKWETELMKIAESQEKLDNAKNYKELEKIYKEFGTKHSLNFQDNKMEISEKFRKFTLSDGFIAYAGKNAANNDELTMKFAKPNDMWMHARGSSGSHVVIPLNKDQKLPKKILEQAAGIAAYYSGAKNAKYTPVAYCLKKYVRKPKGANPGSVLISRENVIMVEPKLPDSNVEA